jgi:NitT/TauT family transport system permease protein
MTTWFQPRRDIPRPLYASAAALAFLVVLCGWHLASAHYASLDRAALFPSPASVLTFAGRVASGGPEAGTFAADLQTSVLRVTAAFTLAAAIAIPVGVLAGSFRLAEATVQPLSEFVRYIPVPALIPLLIVVFGIDETSKIMLIFLGTFFQMLLMVSDEVRRVPYELVQAGYTLGGTPGEAVTKILLPAAWPGIWDALRVCNGWAWSWVIVAELVAANQGLGFRIVKFQRFIQTDRIFFYLLVLGLVGLLLDLAFRAIGRVAFRWSQPARA